MGMEDSGLVVGQLGPFFVALFKMNFYSEKKNEMNEFECPSVKRYHFKKDLVTGFSIFQAL